MKRRDFLKAIGLGGVSLAIPPSLLTGEQRKDKEVAEQILEQTNDRIEKYRKGEVILRLVGPDDKPLKAGLTVNIEQKRHKFLFGCNIFKLSRCRTSEDNANYEKHFASLLNYATLPFYWWSYEREQGKPDDERTDEIVRWCKAHDVTTKGHPLAWNWAEPPWLPDEPEAVMQAQFDRIKRCVRRFTGDIDIWDVVNEATDYVKERAPKLTEAIQRMGVGAYVCQAFEAARRANPKATLIINDYRTDPDYEGKVISQLVDENGQPLYDVIGIQSHMHGGYWGAERAWQVCERFAKFRKPLHFTELTILSGHTSSPRPPRWDTTPEGERRQAEQVVELYRVLFSHPAVEAVTWWDFTDQGAWQRAPAGLVRADMTPKPAYEKLMDLIRNQWWTRTEATLQAKGQARFKGFLGQYDVTVQSGAHQLTGSFWFDKSTSQTISVQMS